MKRHGLQPVADARAMRRLLQIQAEENAQEANRMADIAMSREFAAQALGYMAGKPDLASLLAVEAYLRADTFEARDALLTGLLQKEAGAVQDFASPPPDLNDITGVSFSSDGQRLAWGTSAGAIVVWNYRTQKDEQSIASGCGFTRVNLKAGPWRECRQVPGLLDDEEVGRFVQTNHGADHVHPDATGNTSFATHAPTT